MSKNKFKLLMVVGSSVMVGSYAWLRRWMARQDREASQAAWSEGLAEGLAESGERGDPGEPASGQEAQDRPAR